MLELIYLVVLLLLLLTLTQHAVEEVCESVGSWWRDPSLESGRTCFIKYVTMIKCPADLDRNKTFLFQGILLLLLLRPANIVMSEGLMELF